jgi:RecA/RadA recombinase
MSILERMKKSGASKLTASLAESMFFNEKDFVQTEIPIINIAASGLADGGISSGLTAFAAPSRHYKSLLGLIMVSAYMRKYPDSVCLFYDSEFGITPEYIKSNNIDTSRVLHIPIAHIEQLKFDICKRLDEIKRGDKVIIFIDSIGNLASKKEVDDALSENEAADMTRAKVLKSLWRIITPHLTIKDIPCIAIQHVYQTQEKYSKAVMSGGTGGMLSANQVWIISKAQEKDGDELVGYNFTINIEKSRYVKEKSKLTFTVKWDGGIQKYSGLMEIALESGNVVKPSNGWYSKVDMLTGEVEAKKYRFKDTDNDGFWGSILSSPEFKNFTKEKYQVAFISELEKIDCVGVV